MTPFDRAEAAWESTWIDGPDYEREDDLDEVEPHNPQQPVQAGEEQDDDVPF